MKPCGKTSLKDSYIRLVVTRGVGDLGLDPRKCPKPSVIIITDTIVLHVTGAKENGITTMFSWVRRNPVDATSHEIKSLNYLNSVLAKIEANANGADEAICLESNGYVAEGVGENVVHREKRRIINPAHFNRRTCRDHR